MAPDTKPKPPKGLIALLKLRKKGQISIDEMAIKLNVPYKEVKRLMFLHYPR